MKISLIGPKWNELVNSYPPLGLGYLAAVAEQEGHEVRIHDMGLRPTIPVAEDMKAVLDFKPDLVAFTSMTTSYYSVEQAAAIVKGALGVPTVIGGPHATSLPEQTIADPHQDFLIYGEGEETWRELLQALVAKDDRYERIAGLWFKRDGQVVRNAERPLIPDLDSLPFPSRHLYELDKYPLYAPDGSPMLTALSSRGCPYACSFCFKGIVGRTYRQRSPQNIFAELEHVHKTFGVRNFYFIDDLFTIDVRRLEAILDYFIARGAPYRWRCLARVDRVNPNLLRKMYQAGCRQIHYGIESGNPEILKATAKHINLEQVRRAATWTMEAGIKGKGYFILGLPGDTEETMEDTISFAESLDLDEAMFSIATPFPGTRLWDELVRQRPGTVYNADFTKTYYFNSYTSEIAPFMNVSNVSDDVLSGKAIEARRRFLAAKARRRYYRYFGPRLGEVVYRLSRVRAVKAIGRRVLNMGFFPKFRAQRPRGEAEAWA